VIFDKGDHFHLSAALRAGERLNFIDLTDHLGPAAADGAADRFLPSEEQVSKKQARMLMKMNQAHFAC